MPLTKPGNISQWGEVKKKNKERSQSKAKEPVTSPSEVPNQSARGGRGRGGLESSRGGRGRGSDRGRGAGRGGRGGLMNGSRDTSGSKKEDVPIADVPGWDNTPSTDGITGGSDSAAAESTPLESSWENITTAEGGPPVPTSEDAKPSPQPSSKPDGTRSWASMFSKPAPVPAPPKVPHAAPGHDALIEPPIAATPVLAEPDLPGLPPPPILDTTEAPNTPPTSDFATSDQAANITPSKDDLTETNLEQVLDVSNPAPAATAASTVASTVDPLSGAPSQQASRPPLGGFATSAYKATGMPGRSASYQRKIQEQQEAVVMPGKHAVDRAAVQFGSMGLNGTTEDADVDSDREDAETRAQPPQHSPIAPRAALPPAPQQQGYSVPPPNDALPTPRQAPGLPPVNQSSSIQGLSSDHDTPSQSNQVNYPYNRYGPQQELSAPAQKPYEPFGQQIQSHPGEFTSTSQAPSQSNQQAQSHAGGYTSAPNETSSYYTSEGQRNAYPNNYFGNYGQQTPSNNIDSSASQQRGPSVYGASEQPSQFPANQGQSQSTQSRFGQVSEAQNSGHSTPNPLNPGHQQPNQPHQMHQQQAHGQNGGQHAGYPYNHAYYSSPYYSAYMNHVSNHSYGRERPMFDDVRRYEDQYLSQNPQFGAYGGSQGGYGGGPFGASGKQGMYGQPHHGYGISPQTSYDQHSASPANAGAFGQQHTATSGRDSAAPGGLGSYGRSGSAQPSDNPQQFPNSGTGNHSDVFGRSQAGYPGQGAGFGGHVSQQGGTEDSLRSYGDSSKVAGGPSPALGQPSGRPGSAATPQAQAGLPQPQGQSQGQQGYGGYMGQMHGQGGSQYGGGPAGLGGHHQYGGQSHQGAGYGAYGAGYGSSSYGNSNRGGWGANYGH